jgi:general stress protein CsbA
MRDSVFKTKLIAIILLVAGLVMVLLPFHAFLTVWAGANLGYYTAFRLWKEYLVFLIGLGAIGLLVTDRKMASRIIKTKLSWVIGAYVALELVMALIAHLSHTVSGKALAYGMLDDLRFLAFFIICWVAASYSKRLNNIWYKLIIWPAVIVVGFGLLQMSVLPINFLAHFGYGPKTIMPFQTINSNSHFVRILSTLRGANPLGTYLILPISVLAVLIVRYPKSWTWAKALLFIGSVIVLFGSYSRAAWVGAVLACLVVLVTLIKREYIMKFKWHLIVAGIAVIIGLGFGGYMLRRSSEFQNIIFHTQTHSAAPVSSDQAHLVALLKGVKYLAHRPLGAGPGVSGPASLYNHYRPPRITENYFLEVGEETGWLGLILFMAINVLVAYRLWQRRASPFALALLAALVGITFVNLLSLAWTDDTLSYLWWGLAGLAMVLPIKDKILHSRKLKN